jgi:hypothetical protein
MLDGTQLLARSSAPAPAEPTLTWDPEHRAPADEVVVARGARRDPRIELAPPDLEWQRMVRWYDPRNLFRSAKKILFSTVIGKYADQRRVALGNHRPRFFDYRSYGARDERGGLWIDYVADSGDGWDSTYTVARGAGEARLTVGAPPGDEGVTELPRASILVFGGDAVYPVGSRRGYDERLVAPYAAAIHDLPAEAPHPDVFAIPGNHDWYDSLVAFSRKFISNRWFAHWRTLQNRSYFALRLPGRWWLLGTDVQLGSDIDGEQLEYFEHIAAEHMKEDDRVILCNAEPHWISAAIAGERDLYHSNNLKDLETRVLKDRTWVYLAGDLHHYRRHTCKSDGRLKITAGGGGAFMHPTHTNLDRIATIPDEGTDERGGQKTRNYELEQDSSFPPPERSRRVVLMNLLPLGVVWRQPLFFLAPALLYLLTAWMVPLNLAENHMVIDYGTVLHRISSRLLFESHAAALWTGLIVVGFVMLTPLKHPLGRIAGGLAHSLAHMSAVLLCAWLATQLTLGLHQDSAWTYLLKGLLIFAMGGVIGSTIFGWYLAIMCELFGVHENEATATQGWSHWKSFLRLRIGPDGELTIHPIGIAKTPKWSPRGYRKGAGKPIPRDGRQDHEIYRYIEPPIVIPPPR